MLNQFVGIGKVIKTYEIYQNDKYYNFYQLQLCDGEDKNLYTFNGMKINAIYDIKKSKKLKKEIKENDVVSFKGHYFNENLELESLMKI